MTRKFTQNYVAVAYFGFYMNLKKETEEMLISRHFLYIQNDTGNMGYLEWNVAGKNWLKPWLADINEKPMCKHNQAWRKNVLSG